MKSAISCCAAGAVAAGLMLSTAAAAAPAAGDEAQIRALEQQFSAAFNAKDVDAIMKVYVTDNSLFVFDVGTPRQHVGAADYRKDWQGFLAGFKGPLKFTLSDLAITTDGTPGFGHCV